MSFYSERNSESTARAALSFHSLGSFLKTQVDSDSRKDERSRITADEYIYE